MLLGRAQLWLGEAEKALPHFEQARGLLPTSELPRCLYNAAFGHVLFWLGRLEESEQHFLRAVTVAPHMKIVHAFLVATYGAQQRHAEARAAAHEVLRCDPGFSVRAFADEALMYRKPAWRERMMGLLRAAGLPG